MRSAEPKLLRVLTASRRLLAFMDGIDPGYTSDEVRLLSKAALERKNVDMRVSVMNELDAALDALDRDHD